MKKNEIKQMYDEPNDQIHALQNNLKCKHL
jgi:hypothetical protein